MRQALFTPFYNEEPEARRLSSLIEGRTVFGYISGCVGCMMRCDNTAYHLQHTPFFHIHSVTLPIQRTRQKCVLESMKQGSWPVSRARLEAQSCLSHRRLFSTRATLSPPFYPVPPPSEPRVHILGDLGSWEEMSVSTSGFYDLVNVDSFTHCLGGSIARLSSPPRLQGLNRCGDHEIMVSVI